MKQTAPKTASLLTTASIVALLAFGVINGEAKAAEGLVLENNQQLIGEDLVPLEHRRLRGELPELSNWVAESFSDDPGEATHYLPDTLAPIVLPDGRSGLSFVTWESGGFWRHMVVRETENELSHYRTPMSPANRDGKPVFEEALGIELPETPYADLDEQTYAAQSEDEQGKSLPFTMSRASKADAFAQAAATASMAYGSYLGSFNGVAIYSNGSNGYYSGSTNAVNGYTTGIKWQCVEFTTRYFWQKFGRKIGGGNANTQFSNALAKGLNRAPNGSSNGPQAGNLICSNGGSYGHCAIVASVNPSAGYLAVVEQNWANNGADANQSHRLSLKVTTSGGKNFYNVGGFNSSYPVVGWMWPCSGTCKEYR